MQTLRRLTCSLQFRYLRGSYFNLLLRSYPCVQGSMLDAPPALDTEVQLLERRYAENPDGRFFVPLADRYRKLGDLARAEALLRQGLQRYPDYVSARLVLGQCLADEGRPDEAATEFRRVLDADPQNLLALRNLGRLAAAAGQTAEAERWYTGLLSVDPMNEDARRALEALAAAPEAAPDEPSFYLFEDPSKPEAEETGGIKDGELATETIAELYSRQGFHDRAADVYRELLRRRGDDPDLRQRLSEAERLAAGEAAEAVEPARPVTISEALADLLAWPNAPTR